MERQIERDLLEEALTANEAESGPIPQSFKDEATALFREVKSSPELSEEGEWHAAFWGNFRNDAAVLDWAGIRDEELFASVLIGRADGNDIPSTSLRRPVPARHERVRRVAP